MRKPYPGLEWRALAANVWSDIWEDGIFGRAAQLAYYFLLSLFPLLLLLTSVLGYLAQTGAEVRQALLAYFSQVVPGAASELVNATLKQITAAPGSLKLSITAVTTMWAASNGMAAIMDGLNAAYKVKEGRPWWKLTLSAIWLTVVLSFLTIGALVLLLWGDRLGARFGLGLAWKLVRWPIILGFLFTGFALVYRYAPNVRYAGWRWVFPGAATGMALWLVASSLLKLYMAHFDGYARLYGGLGAVIVLLLWFYVSGIAILTGGEVNSVIENTAAGAGEKEAKLPGQKAPRAA
jgi:membrane protein